MEAEKAATENFVDEVRRRAFKCGQHLARAKLAADLGRTAVLETDLTRHADLIRLSVDSPGAGPEKIADAITRSLFLDLKVNFELFLWTICRAWLQFDFVGSMRRITSACETSKSLRRHFKDKTMADFFSDDVDEILPPQGLEALSSVLNAVTPGAGVDRGEEWNQVTVAFEVRHLVEHRNGKVHEGFLRKVGPLWIGSSWGQIAQRHPAPGTRVSVSLADFDATYSAMTACVKHVEERSLAGWSTAATNSKARI